MIAAYMILHYGREWLKYSLRSIVDEVDEIHISYTSVPSHSYHTDLKNPETEEELYLIARPFDVFWHNVSEIKFAHEGEHRDHAVGLCADRGAEIILVVDADEIWIPSVLENALDVVKNSNYRTYMINMIHFWRSVTWVCEDPGWPTRFIKPDVPINNAYISGEQYVGGRVFHMGYAQTPEIIKYKQSIHGHKGEWRPGWFEEKFLTWKPGMTDVHPTCIENFWEPKPFVDNDGILEYLIGDHPYWNLEIIE